MRKIELKRLLKDRSANTIRTSAYTFHTMDLIRLYTHKNNIAFLIGDIEEILALQGDDWTAYDLLSPIPGVRQLAEDYFKEKL